MIVRKNSIVREVLSAVYQSEENICNFHLHYYHLSGKVIVRLTIGSDKTCVKIR